ncbi:putative lipid II flippase FtsW [Betaproteobacteria bacterium PRO4]|uniref:putative lipid II flippase FtsW n=1 Tax=Nitrosomonas sp. TaxID=42353 RepID=UPI00256529B0|nr:putative lipid II flippase FtsW [Nitrosomonas sp.]MBE7527881.1 putative lipid II flippase FtsW [Burkholderiales bacterium]MDL1865663.1 putative lipid II flippase FtsW [Betaproteobacteria bacterium PRO4]
MNTTASVAPTASHNQPIQPGLDLLLVVAVLLLLGLGLVMVYSASIAIAESKFGEGNSHYFLVRQVLYILAGIAVGNACFRIPLRWWQTYSHYLLGFGILLLVVVLVPGISHEINGSRRWLSLVIFNFQPSELMKLFILIFTADYVVRKAAFKDHFFKGFLPILALLTVVSLLLLMEPDLGATVVIAAIVLSVMFMNGMNWKMFLGLVCLVPVLIALLIIIEPYRMDRINAIFDPWNDPFNKGYQLTHALIAFGLGEWWGVGLGNSVEKLNYLPEAHTDFMFAVLAEELGFAGVVAVISLFFLLLVRIFKVGRMAAKLGNQFGSLVAQGIGVWLGLQAFINMGVNMGLLPTKGLTLPFMSYGGSSIVINCIAIAILLRIDWENRLKRRGVHV